MNKKFFIGTAITCIILSLAWIMLTPTLFPSAQANGTITAAHPGFLAPPFTLQTPKGETVEITDFQGQPVLVFFWASWCSVCKAIMPGLQSVYDDYADYGFTILAVNATFQDNLTSAEEYFESQGYSYTFLLDTDGEVSQAYQMRALPTSILVGPDGSIVDVTIGSGMSAGYLRANLDAMLASGQ